MNILIDDVFFFSTLFLCMLIGGYYKRIEDLEVKRNYGAGLGLMVTCLICGQYIYHTVFIVWGNIIIIKCCDKKYAHQLSLAYTWIYISYMYISLEASVYIMWLHQNIALRLVGLAFEMHIDEKARMGQLDNLKSSIELNIETAVLRREPTAVDIITYSFYFVGLHKGPYYRWKIFEDHFVAPFGVLADCRIITEYKLKKAFIFCCAYLLLRIKFDPYVYYDDTFYQVYGNETRYLYNAPLLLMFYIHRQMLMMLCTSVFTEAGFGIYPAKTNAQPGHGPTVAHSWLNVASKTAYVALKQEYNFSMLKCFQNDQVVFGSKMRETLRGFDMPTRYWFTTFIYAQIKANREIRSACSFAAWWVWSGPTLPHLIMAVTLWIYVQLEDECAHLINTNYEEMKLPWNLGFSLMRVFCLLYLTPCLIVNDTIVALRYYNSIYWVYHILLLVLILVLTVSNKIKSRNALLTDAETARPVAETARPGAETARPEAQAASAS